MKKILFKLPNEEQIEEFFKIYSAESKIDVEILNLLYVYFKDDFWFILAILGSNTNPNINVYNVDKLDKLGLMLKIYHEIFNGIQDGEQFDEIVYRLGEIYRFSTNQILTFYESILTLMKKCNINKGEKI